MLTPQVINHWYLSMELCVPDNWPDSVIGVYAESEDDRDGWRVRPVDSPMCSSAGPSRIRCHRRPGFVHVLVDL
jgi:hypothetical protein